MSFMFLDASKAWDDNHRDCGRRLNISQSAVSRSFMTGQKIERENQFELIG